MLLPLLIGSFLVLVAWGISLAKAADSRRKERKQGIPKGHERVWKRLDEHEKMLGE